jgi:sugar/nucleoside kinase (ribokinase family)
MVVVKRGAQGCLLQRDGETVEQPGFAVPVRDTTGAGDAVAAALILAWLSGYDLPATAALANAAGAATVQRLGGGLNLPGVAEINALLQREGIALPPA